MYHDVHQAQGMNNLYTSHSSRGKNGSQNGQVSISSSESGVLSLYPDAAPSCMVRSAKHDFIAVLIFDQRGFRVVMPKGQTAIARRGARLSREGHSSHSQDTNLKDLVKRMKLHRLDGSFHASRFS